MLALLFFGLVIICRIDLFNAQSDLPKLPIFVAIGYDILEGNPKTNKIDPGFRSKIFKITYDEKKTTLDKKYLIPDGMITNTLNTYTYSSKSEEFTGTKNYQKELQTLVSIEGGFNTPVTKAGFTQSSEYEFIHESTRNEKYVIMEAQAKCETYSLQVPRFETLELTPDFKTAIMKAYEKEIDWMSVIYSFGTHYSVSVKLGGRAVREHKLKRFNSEELNSKRIDIKLMTRLEHAKSFGEQSSEWKSKEKELNEFISKTDELKVILIGGKPSNTWKEWTETVKGDVAPIEYSLVILSELFNQRNFPEYSRDQLIEMKKMFNSTLDKYCQGSLCKVPEFDDPSPGKLRFTKHESKIVGGWGGYLKSDIFPDSALMTVTKVFIRHGRYIDSLQFEASDEFNTITQMKHGGNGGTHSTWVVPNGHRITSIELQVRNGCISQLIFHTDKGTRSPTYGRGKGYHDVINLKGHLVGVIAKSARFLDQVKFVSYEIKKD